MKSIAIKFSFYCHELFLRRIYFRYKGQNLSLAVLGGAIMAIVCAIVWAMFAFVTESQVAIIALFLGFLVGTTVKICGRGADPVFRAIGASLSLAGSIAGNFMGTIGIIASRQNVDFLTALLWLDSSTISEIIPDLFETIDCFFYLIAAFFGHYFSSKNHNASNHFENQRVL